MGTDSRAAPPESNPGTLISEQAFANVVRRHSEDLVSPTGTPERTSYPFDDPLFDFIVTCRSDEAAYETAPEIARAYRGIDIPERRAIEQLTAALDPRAHERAERYMMHWGYSPGPQETVRALLDLVRSRVGRGACPTPVGMCWLAYQSGLSTDLRPFLQSWRAWTKATTDQRENIESHFINTLLTA